MRATSPESDFCPELFHSFHGRLSLELAESASFSRRFLSQTEDSFPNFSNRKIAFWREGSMGQSFDFFLLPLFHPVTIHEWPGFLSLFNRLQVIECGELTCIHIALTVSLSACWFKPRRVEELTSPSLSLWHITSHNVCTRDPPWYYKKTQFSRQHRSVTHTNLEWYVLTVFSTMSYPNFRLDKNLHPRCRQN